MPADSPISVSADPVHEVGCMCAYCCNHREDVSADRPAESLGDILSEMRALTTMSTSFAEIERAIALDLIPRIEAQFAHLTPELTRTNPITVTATRPPAADRPVENSELREEPPEPSRVYHRVGAVRPHPSGIQPTGGKAEALSRRGDREALTELLEAFHECDPGTPGYIDISSRIEELFASLQQKPERWFPLQDGPRIPWSVAEKAYEDYARRYGRSQTLERLAERGGFGVGEMDDHHPKWRDEVEEIPKLRAEISRLRADAPSKELIAEMAKQASLGHRRFCVGIHQHESGEVEEEWIEWADAFRRISGLGSQ